MKAEEYSFSKFLDDFLRGVAEAGKCDERMEKFRSSFSSPLPTCVSLSESEIARIPMEG